MRVAARPNVILTPHVAWASDEAQQAWPISWSTTSRTSLRDGRRIWSKARTDPIDGAVLGGRAPPASGCEVDARRVHSAESRRPADAHSPIAKAASPDGNSARGNSLLEFGHRSKRVSHGSPPRSQGAGARPADRRSVRGQDARRVRRRRDQDRAGRRRRSAAQVADAARRHLGVVAGAVAQQALGVRSTCAAPKGSRRCARWPPKPTC